MDVRIGTRRLQEGNGAFLLNIPVYAVRTLGLLTGDRLSVILTDDGTLRIEKEKDEIPVTGANLPSQTPVTGAHRTRKGADVNDNIS